MSPDTLARMAIQSQGRSPFLLIGAVVAAVLVGAILGWLGRTAGVPEKVTYSFPLVLGMGVAAFVIWYSVAPQGWITLTADALTVEPRLRSSQVWVRGSSEPTLRAWQLRTETITRTAGALLEFRGRDGSFTVGAHDPELAQGLPTAQGFTLLVPPDFLVTPDDFRRLVDDLGIRPRPGQGPQPQEDRWS